MTPLEITKMLRLISMIENEVGLSNVMEQIRNTMEKRLATYLAVPLQESEE